MLDAINADHRITIYPLEQTILEQNINFSAITEMHDRLIVATAIILRNREDEIGLLTCDRNITASNLLNIIW